MARDLALEMARRGHEVEVSCPFPNRPGGRLFQSYRRRLLTVEEHRAYRLWRSWHTLSRRSNVISRGFENLTFGLSSSLVLRRIPRPDVAYMNTWPLMAQWMNATVLHRLGIPTVCAVKDLYPESGFRHPMLDRGIFSRMARALDGAVYRRCAIVAALNETTRERICSTRRVRSEKVVVRHDWVDAAPFEAQASESQASESPAGVSVRRQLGVPDDAKVAMYVGSLAAAAGLELILDVAEELRGDPRLRIVLAGDGVARPLLQRRVADRGLRNILFHPDVTPGDVPALQAAADVLLLSLRSGVARHTAPSKLMSYLFSARPVVAAVDADSAAARMIQDARCGEVVPPGDAGTTAGRIRELIADPDRGEILGESGRAWAHARFHRDRALPALCDLLEETASTASLVVGRS